MVEQRRDKRWRVSGYDDNNDIQAFETDDRDRAEAMREVFRENLKDVVMDKLRVRP